MAVPVSFLNWRIRASTGKAVMHIDAPRNIVPAVNEVFSGKRVVCLKKNQPKVAPRTNGVIMPAIETAAALRSRWLTMSRWNSNPTTNM